MKNKLCRCSFCGQVITDTEIQFEDYYSFHRGCTLGAEAGYICFDCLQKCRANSLRNNKKIK